MQQGLQGQEVNPTEKWSDTVTKWQSASTVVFALYTISTLPEEICLMYIARFFSSLLAAGLDGCSSFQAQVAWNDKKTSKTLAKANFFFF